MPSVWTLNARCTRSAWLLLWTLPAVAYAQLFRLPEDPWVPPPLLWRGQAQLVGARYTWNPCGSMQESAPWHSWWGGAAGLALAPTATLDATALLTIAGGSVRPFGWDTARLFVRSQWWDDLLGDPISITPLAQLYFASHDALRSPAEFVPGNVNAELGVAIGKELSGSVRWLARTWMMGCVGQSNVGKPWIRGLWAAAIQPWCGTQCGARVEAVQTFGPLREWSGPFPGYGRTRSFWFDLAGWIGIDRDLFTLSLEGAWRLHAVAAPRQQAEGQLQVVVRRSF